VDPAPARIAVKRLAVVEVLAERSHQHELNAGRLRLQLGLPDGRSEGRLTVLAYETDGVPPEASEGAYTLYDARESTPGRSEYRLYYDHWLMAGGRPGDLIVMYRQPGERNLRAVIAAAGTRAEAELLRLLEVGRDVDPGCVPVRRTARGRGGRGRRGKRDSRREPEGARGTLRSRGASALRERDQGGRDARNPRHGPCWP